MCFELITEIISYRTKTTVYMFIREYKLPTDYVNTETDQDYGGAMISHP